MNKTLTPAELASSAVSFPTLSRHDKLVRWATIIRATPTAFLIFHRLEYQKLGVLRATTVHPDSAFAAAFKDPILKDAGLQGSTFGDAMDFFELNQGDLHEFSCDCGGVISNEKMAKRIEGIAGVVDSSSWTDRALRMMGH